MGAILFQLRKRLGVAPRTVPLGPNLRVIADQGAGGASNLVYFGRYFEYDEVHFIERLLRPGDHVLDGGANIGKISLLASRLVGDQGRVISFEPAGKAVELLRNNLALNEIDNVDVVAAALGAQAGEMKFIVDMDVSNKLVRVAPPGRKIHQVPVVALSDTVEHRSWLLTKLDLEGGEYDALRGAEALIAKGLLPVLLLEASDHQLRRLDSSRDQVLELLRRHGYRFAEYSADANRLDFQDPPRTVNFVAVHKAFEPELESRLGL